MSKYYLNGYTPPSQVNSKSDVVAMQSQLNAAGAGLKLDGIWGPKTEAAYLQFMNSGSPNGGGSAASQWASGAQDYINSAYGLFDVPTIDYQPMSEAQLLAQIEGAYRPAVDLAISRRREQTQTNRAEIDVDAYSRGMGPSTYVTDIKGREMDAEASDISAMESEYSAMVMQALMQAMQQENDRMLAVEQYNSQLQYNASQNAYSAGMSAYEAYLAQQAAAAKGSGSRSSSKSKGANASATEEDAWRLLSLCSKQERDGIYNGKDAKNTALRDEIISVLGPMGYLEAQSLYPGT
ncbi:hypothetical protein LJC42_04780 [Eubacteriales bacterium OttesenSCG-928-K08]|nr:hypothetical protein [Eubacteriales bacterium OttesenSCG-928-K08]